MVANAFSYKKFDKISISTNIYYFPLSSLPLLSFLQYLYNIIYSSVCMKKKNIKTVIIWTTCIYYQLVHFFLIVSSNNTKRSTSNWLIDDSWAFIFTICWTILVTFNCGKIIYFCDKHFVFFSDDDYIYHIIGTYLVW